MCVKTVPSNPKTPNAIDPMTFMNQKKKTDEISPRHHWFPLEMTSGERAQKFHTDECHN